MFNSRFISEALTCASLSKEEYRLGSIVVQGNNIVGRGVNSSYFNASVHSEMAALESAAAYYGLVQKLHRLLRLRSSSTCLL